EDLGVADSEILIGIVGRLVAEKGYPELFEAIRRVGSQFRLVCIGPEDPDKSDGLGEDVLAEARAGGVILTGMRTDVERLYPAMDIFVLPSHREGFPRSAMEAAASGLPVVATDIRGCREVVDDGVSGLLVPVRDPGALARAFDSLSDPATRDRMGAAGRIKALEEFDERRVVARVFGTYADVADAKGLADLSTALRAASGTVAIREAVAADAPFCARLHRRAIDTGFLSSLGDGFLTTLYRALIDDESSSVLVATDESGPVGFVAGTLDTGTFYSRFLRRFGFEAGLRAVPRLLRPSAIRKVVETVRYGSGAEEEDGAELLSMAVIAERRGRGIAALLQDKLLDRLVALGAGGVRVVVGSRNAGAIAAYRKAGFRDLRTIEVHAGDSSEVLEWRP
ncbi:MAG: GNAT family N-acetyltransferase, partial [Acidimicrobiia bacterium]|nr:GNAT family N-acetyltransferase [Acidimicrobiia bacterium]